MSSPFSNVLPVLRTPQDARRDPDTYYVEIPGDRVGATPWAAFTTGDDLLKRADVVSSGVSGGELLKTAITNLSARPAAWKVEEAAGGFLGFGKTPCILSFTDEFAAEQLLVESFLKKAQTLISPKSINRSRVAYFAPKRGQIRAVAATTKTDQPTPYIARERELAKQAWEAAGADAVCPAVLHPSHTVGNMFAVSELFAGERHAYVPPADSVRLMVMHKKTFSYITSASTSPKREFVGDLFLFLGVRDENGQQTPLDDATLNELGLPFEASFDAMLAKVPVMPVIEMGRLKGGQPVVGFRGNGAIDQLASPESLGRLHATLGDSFLMHAYSHVRVAATKSDMPRTVEALFDLIELCDPKPPGVIMTRGTPDFEVYTVEGGKVTGTTRIGR